MTSMHSVPAWEKTRSASLLLEALIAIAVFAIFLGGVGLTLVIGERSTVAGGDRVRATFAAEQVLEAVRQMRNQDFSSLTAGTYGVAFSQGVWGFTGSSVTTADGYTTRVNITSKGTDWWQADAIVVWDFGKTRSGSLTIPTFITDWRKVLPIGNWAQMTLAGQATVAGTPEFQKVAISGNYAFVTSDQSSGGMGLYIFDVSNPASPVRIAGSFDLGASAYGLAINGTNLYLATDAPSAEIQAYDITTPPSLTNANLIKSFDLPGSGKARSITFYNNILYVGALDNPPNVQFYALQWSESNPITQLGSLDVGGGVMDISLSDGYAYIATTANSAELEVVDIFDPANLAFAPGNGIDLTNVQDGSAMLTFGTSALIGRLAGSMIDELTLYSIADAPVPVPPPGPWTLELEGDANALASIYGGTYGFVASDATSAQLRVLDMQKFSAGQPPVVKTYDAAATIRGLYYNWQNDRLFSVTPTTLLVFAPG